MRQLDNWITFESLCFTDILHEHIYSSWVHTCVWVFGIDHSNRCSNSGVVKHHYLIVVTGEPWRVVIYILHLKYNVCLAWTSSSISRLDDQVILCFLLPVQEGESEQLTCLWQRHDYVMTYSEMLGSNKEYKHLKVFNKEIKKKIPKKFFYKGILEVFYGSLSTQHSTIATYYK